ncbi:hypothetical protein FRX31_016722 [Thalictrum thalictroides]|uniref:Uncharacterized protein n=1 Tax=Thalictrum thalictroides TaxID=46969 RepID=A0A7J6W8E3_THATH|nr:hypothetical protein FRX31_016722 [Thalictrum thalictroides]
MGLFDSLLSQRAKRSFSRHVSLQNPHLSPLSPFSHNAHLLLFFFSHKSLAVFSHQTNGCIEQSFFGNLVLALLWYTGSVSLFSIVCE